MEETCLFCQIIAGEQPAQIVLQDDQMVAVQDVNPQAPTHILVLPREHIESLNDAAQSDEALLGHLLRMASKIANQMNLADDGYRVVINTGPSAGQSVYHLHMHILGGRPMRWPPG
jgi:histidine triad (HIT) family protein